MSKMMRKILIFSEIIVLFFRIFGHKFQLFIQFKSSQLKFIIQNLEKNRNLRKMKTK